MVYFVRTFLIFLCLGAGFPDRGRADDRLFRLAVPQDLIVSGVLGYMLPRFSLKTQVRIEIVPDGADADASLGARGRAVFSGLGRTFHLQKRATDHKGVARFETWLMSDIGQRTVVGFRRDGVQVFAPPPRTAPEVAEVRFDGNAAVGKDLSRSLCARCHVVTQEERMNSIGSTPSFFALRTLPDWTDRFETFYALNPHPSFTQIKDVTAGFAHDRPPPIKPVEMTLDDLASVMAYVASLAPADLGAPIAHQ